MISGPIAIIGAMVDEVAAIIADLKSPVQHVIAGRTFHRGTLHGNDVVLVVSRIGKVAAASTATIAIERFGARALIFTGVAGGVAAHMQVGDIVIADALIHHDVDARPLFPQWEVPLLGVVTFATDRAWSDRALAAATAILAHDQIRAHGERLGIGTPTVHRGLIASGDQFFSSAQSVDALRTALPDVLAVEMEGAAVAQVAHEYGIPCAVIRTISDRADHAAAIDFQHFVTHALAPYARALMQQLLS